MNLCVKCGVAKLPVDFQKGNVCRACRRAYEAAWAARNPEKRKRYKRKAYQKNRVEILQKSRAWRRTENRAFLNQRLQRMYGISIEEYDGILDGQRGRCAICGDANNGGRRLVVDHDHDTGCTRGLLCTLCNRALGLFHDDLVLLNAAAAYLARPKRRSSA